jgi:uncharacterized circularly permuted ATP-grasp superfamily protein
MFERVGYQPVRGHYDEAVDPDGRVRPSWSVLGAAFGEVRPGQLLEHQRQTDRLLDAEGAGHLVHELAHERWPDAPAGAIGDSRPWRLDPVPLVLAHDEHRRLVDGVVQRVRFLEALLADLYGDQRLIRNSVVSPRVLWSVPSLRTTMALHRPKKWLVHYAVDVARTSTGEWRVVQDLTDAPSGLGYALLNRSVMARVVPDAVRTAGAAPIAGFADVLRRALAAQSPDGRRSPRTVVLTGGPGHATYVEHSYLAMQMGFHLAEGGDLVVRKNRVWLRALDGVEPVDVIYRRLEDGGLDPLDTNTSGSAGVPALTWAARSGGVVIGNAFGTRLAEESLLAPSFDGAAQLLIGEPLQLRPLDPTESLATTPVYAGARTDSLMPGEVVVRLHAAVVGDQVHVMHGGVGRVLSPGDHPSAPSARLVKDVWVVGSPASTRTTPRIVSHPQVDFGSSVPRRAADALYWMGRAAERAEVGARTVRVLAAQVQQDPSLVALGGGGWSNGALALLRAAQGLPLTTTDPLVAVPLLERVQHELRAANLTVASQIGTVVQEATSVREFLSTTTGRVLGRLTRLRADLLGAETAADDLDIVLVDLAALAGLAMESTVRGPAWRFLDMGRRVERALGVVGSIEAALGLAVEPLAFQPLTESLLQVNESLVAYRRRYRSDVEIGPVVDLLVHDDANPRSLSFQLDRLREHVASLAWREGGDLVHAASLGAITLVDEAISGGRRLSIDALVLATRGPLLALGDAVQARWFADPVNPVVMGGR